MGSHAPHGSDRRFLGDECQSSHGVWGNLDLLHFLPYFRVWGLGRGGIAIDWVTQRWRFWQMHLRLMYSQATVRSYTKDRAVLRWETTPLKGGGYKVVQKPTPPKSLMWEPTQATLDIGLVRPLWWKGYRPRVRPLCGSPKVPSD